MSTKTPPPVKKSDGPLRIAFIGFGFIGRHQARLLRKVEGAQVVAVADIKQEALDVARDEFGVSQLYTDYNKMLAEVKDLDAVSVCTPNGLHAVATIAALDAGKHVMCEKPMAMNAKEAQSMVDASKRNRRKLIIGFQWRFDTKSAVIKKQIDAGAFGKILYVRAQALRRRGIPNWGVFGQKKLQGGGPMIDIGVHMLEAAHYIIGSPKPVSATGNTWTYMGDKPSDVESEWKNWDYKTYSVEDLAAGMIRFTNGIILTIEASFVAHIEKELWNIQIMGEKAGANWDSSQIYSDQHGYMMNSTPAFLGKWDHFEYKMRHFVEVIRDNRPNEAPGEHGVMVQKMLDAVYESAEEGHEIEIG